MKKKHYYFTPVNEEIRTKKLESQRLKCLESAKKKNNETLAFILIFIVLILLMEN